jgi:hypothetical protein
MIINDKGNKVSTYVYIILFISMVLIAIIPANGAIEQRGPLVNISAGGHTILNGENCPGFYYSTTSGTYYESLELNFSKMGLLIQEMQRIPQKSLLVPLVFLEKNIRYLEMD